MIFRTYYLLLVAALGLLFLWPSYSTPQDIPLASPGDLEREEYERRLNDAIRKAGARCSELEATLRDARTEVSRFTPETTLDERERVAKTLVDAHTELETLLDKLAAYEAALTTYLGTPILKLVEILPDGTPGASSSSQNLGKLYSVDINEAPLEIIPGNVARFAIDLIQRRQWDSEGSCIPARNRPEPDDTSARLTGSLLVKKNWSRWYTGVADTFVFTWGARVFDRYCDQAPTYTKPDSSATFQVPFEMQDQVRLTVTLRPTKFPHEGSYRFSGEARSSSRKTVHGFDGSQPLFSSTYANADGYCTSPNGKCPNLYIVAGGPNAAAVLHYRHIRAGERFIASLPDYRHPNDFDKPLFVGEPPTLLALPDFTGRPLAEAKDWLENNGLKASLLPGEPAPTPDRTGTVASQNPAAGMELADGASVALYVHAPYVDARTIPDVTGMTISRAKILIEDEGLRWNLLPGQPAPSADDSGRIQKQEPAAGTQVPGETPVFLSVYGPYVDAVRLPDFAGLSFDEAARRLHEFGLQAVHGTTKKPSHRDQSGLIFSQSPAAGSSATKGATVSLGTYGTYTPSRDEQIAQTDCRHLPGAVAIWDQTSGQPTCDCPSGLRWDINNTACVTQHEHATQWCAKHYPNRVPVKLIDGTYQCQCRSGYEINEATNRCVRKLPSRQERVASYNCSDYPGSRAYWNEQAGEPRCGCPSGLRWNMNNTACVTQGDYAREYCARKYPGRRAVRKNDGNWSCECPSGMYVDASSGKCFKPRAASNQGRSRQAKCDDLLFKAREFMKMYRGDPQNLGHMKGVAEGNIRLARSMGCDMSGVDQSTGGGGSGSGSGSSGVPCNCVDSQGRQYVSGFGQPCGTTGFNVDYNCIPQ